MGTDIEGFVEVREGTCWTRAVDIVPFTGRSYDAMGCLFGVRNKTGFSPIAPARGIPTDVSMGLKEELENAKERGYYGHSWISLSEIEDIDRDEASPTGGNRLIVVSGNPTLILDIGSFDKNQQDALRKGKDLVIPDSSQPDGGPSVVRLVPLTRGVALEDFAVLFELMGWLAAHFGRENVRLVVWFSD